MSNIKQIVINPELFRPKSSSSQTRKSRQKTNVDIKPVIGPTKLKSKLLNKLKEHKEKELSVKSNTNLRNLSPKNQNIPNTKDTEDKDEFSEALKFLNQVKKAKHLGSHQKTMKVPSTLQKYSSSNSNYSNSNNSHPSSPYVELELPPELDFSSQPISEETPINLNYRTDNEVPYGCLKNGKKKTYRTWIQSTQTPSTNNFNSSNNVLNYNNIDPLDAMRPPTPPKKQTEDKFPAEISMAKNQEIISQREERLNQIKMKLKRIQENNLVKNPGYSNVKDDLEILRAVTNIKSNNELPDLDADEPMYKNVVETDDLTKLIEERNQKMKLNINKDKYLKKTLKHKVTLGKHAKQGRVGILLNNKTTRKNILNAQRELKKTPLPEVRKFLKQKGLIKVGSTAGKDILMKIFEDSMLAGDIYNVNKETMLYNFIHSENENN
jgi:hypothetical protein